MGHRRLLGVSFVSAALLTAGTVALTATSTSASLSRPTETSTARVVAAPQVDLQLLQPDPAQASYYAEQGVDVVTLELGWDAYQPGAQTFNTDYIASKQAQADAYRAAGLDVVLDLGLQYPPSWARNLPGQTRFVNQYGETWQGGIGDNVLNAVWNPAVRQAQADYIAQVGRDFAGHDIAAVRIGGLLYGEIRLPPAHFNGHTDALWGFDAAAQSTSPVPGWKPGIGAPEQAQAWLNHYLDSLTDYQVWLAQTVATQFPGVTLDVLLPGWGIRPGDAEMVSQALMSQAAMEQTGDDMASGLDWQRQLPALAGTGLDIRLVSTWLDAPSYGESDHGVAPIDYIASIVDRNGYGFDLSGENTGGGGQAALDRFTTQARTHGMDKVTWMSAPDLATGVDGLTLPDVVSGVDGIR